ncbi:hypothetical protein [Pukyongiella litopenaei]|uniref:Bacterial CdiA-CT RNAse A domain-containing protein n=1 Tax=Pukyongiella litopenaei TaxID=2605946 RepID=A0A2S0MN45_9RHOB|nr:hypothetical protein [Pukyongiella litopenaei]AVO37294.1 hypothetical protein C6Y53_05910 [Pukyongiella litopenaei]
MAKKTKAELVKEGKELNAALTAIRKKPHNFALLVGKDGLILETDLKKSPEGLRGKAKKAGGGAKGAVGEISATGKDITLKLAEGENPPGTLARLFKTHLRERGIAANVTLLDSTGTAVGEEGATDTPTDTPAADSDAAPADGIDAKLDKAFRKIQPSLVSALKTGPKDHAAVLAKLTKAYETAKGAGNYEQALKDLTQLRTEIARTPSTDTLDAALAGKDDPARLAGMAGLLVKTLERGGKEADFKKEAGPKLRDMRTALKAALAGSPDAEQLKVLTAMKKRLDRAFLDDLKDEGHGPQRHEGDVTPEQLVDRCVSGHDPMTGDTTDGVHGGVHRYSRHATRFKDPGDYVDAEETIRGNQAYTDEMAEAKRTSDTRFSVELPLKDVLGDDYKTKLEGKSRIGSAKNPQGSQDTDFTDGTITAVYDIDANGDTVLVTMYPNPK